MEFEWDQTKNRANIRKHGVSFTTASRIFEKPILTRRDDRKHYGEDRYVSVGDVGSRRRRCCAHGSRRPNPIDLRASRVQEGKGGSV